MLVAALCAVAALTVGVPGAVARGVLDQTSLPALNEGLSVNDAFEHAQTFTAMRTGFLDTVALSFDQSDQDGRYIVDVVPTDAGGLPAGAPLASRTIDACRVQSSPLEIPFGPAASITAGTRYAIVVASQAGSTPTPSLVWDAGSPYAGGAAFSASPPGPNPAWNPAPFDDLAFSTYVSAAAPPSLARDATQTTVSSGKNPAPPGAVTFTASVTDPSHPGRVPTGTVAFRVANGLTFLQPLDAQGHASQAIDNLPKGATAITAAYCPDADGFESSSSSVNQTIAQDTTETTELANPQAIRVGETTTLTATVKDIDAPGKTPTGTVQFSDSGGQLIGPPVALQSGSATLATSAIPFGLHNIFASYSSSDGFLGPSTGTVQVAVTRWTSATAFAVQPDHAVAGQPVTLAASVTGSTSDGHHPTGDVEFTTDGGNPIAPPTSLDSTGHAALVVSGGAGSYQLAAHYLGDDYFLANDTSSIPLTVDRADTATRITSTPNPVRTGDKLTIDVDVTVLPPGDANLDGPVQFFVDGQAIGQAINLTGFTGVTVTADAGDIAGNATITARYLGGRNTNPSSASLVQTVSGPEAQAPGPAAQAPVSSGPGSTPATPATSLPTTSGPAAAPGAPDATTALAVMSGALRKALGARGLRALDGLTETFTAPTSGRLVQQIFSPSAPRNALSARAAPSLLATAEANFPAATTGNVKLKLTAAGRRALKRTGAVKLTVITRFIPAVGPPTQRVDRISARTRTRSRRTAAALKIPDWALHSTAPSPCPSRWARALTGVPTSPCW